MARQTNPKLLADFFNKISGERLSRPPRHICGHLMPQAIRGSD